MELKPLNEEIGKLVDEFLDDPEYYCKFVDIAQAADLVSDNASEIKMSMFQVVDDQLTFAHKELEEIFFEWQLLKQLKQQEPYATILKKHPEKKGHVIDLASRIMEGKSVTPKDINFLLEDD